MIFQGGGGGGVSGSPVSPSGSAHVHLKASVLFYTNFSDWSWFNLSTTLNIMLSDCSDPENNNKQEQVVMFDIYHWRNVGLKLL